MDGKTTVSRGTIVFDLDGTLVDSEPDLAGALDTLMSEKGLAPIGVDTTRRLIGHGIP
ncbi:MAG: HAD hydrolase-like protein, partial [Shinella sp.]